jgi:hypothetical protein
MTSTLTPPPGSIDCEAVAELLAWHANGTLGATDRAVVDSHVEACGTCRTTLALERRIVESVRAPRDNVEQSPHAGWQKLVARLDADSTAPHERPANGAAARALAAAAPAAVAAIPAGRKVARRLNWSAALGAAVALQAAAIAVLAVALVRHRQAEEAPRFHTLANADPTLAASGPLVRVAFDSAMDEAAARGVAEKVSGRILAGPSPENVYTFVFQPAADAARGVDDDKVSWLRRQAHVLLVEPVVLGQQPVRKP